MSGRHPIASQLQRELETALELARRAGERILGYYKQGLEVDRKAGNEPVTAADRDADALIVKGLRQAFPADGILSEEADEHRSWLAAARAWLVDPLDGTKDFVAERDGFSTMIGLLVEGRPKLGVVYQPTNRLTYFGIVPAKAGGGTPAAFSQRGDAKPQPLSPSNVADPAQARLVASFSHRSQRLTEIKDTLGITDELNVGSVGLKVGLVARGDRDLYVNPDPHCKLWDVCAPEAILHAAGGRMTDLHGQPLRYDSADRLRADRGIVASNGVCHRAVVDRVAPLFRAETY